MRAVSIEESVFPIRFLDVEAQKEETFWLQAKTMAGQWNSSCWKWLLYLSVLLAILAECEGQQQQQQQQVQRQGQQRQRPIRDGTRRQRRHRTDKAKLIQHYLKKNGRLEGMVRLVDGVHANEGNGPILF